MAGPVFSHLGRAGPDFRQDQRLGDKPLDRQMFGRQSLHVFAVNAG